MSKLPTLDYAVRSVGKVSFAIGTDEYGLAATIIESPYEKTPALVLADALGECGLSRPTAIRIALSVRLASIRARSIIWAEELLIRDTRKGRWIRDAVRAWCSVLSYRVPFVVVYGWAEPRVVGRAGYRERPMNTEAVHRRWGPYRRSTLQIVVGSRWLKRALTDLASPA